MLSSLTGADKVVDFGGIRNRIGATTGRFVPGKLSQTPEEKRQAANRRKARQNPEFVTRNIGRLGSTFGFWGVGLG